MIVCLFVEILSHMYIFVYSHMYIFLHKLQYYIQIDLIQQARKADVLLTTPNMETS